MPPEEQARRVGSVGKPMPPTEFRIVDDDGEPSLPAREIGELIVRNPGREREYFNDDDATASTWRDGWLHSGDLAYLDEDGFLYIVGRQKDVIIRGGNNVHATDVEAVLYEHPAVQEAAVAGVPHPVLGEDVGAWVVRADGAAPSTAGELRRLLRRAAEPTTRSPRRGLPRRAAPQRHRQGAQARPARVRRSARVIEHLLAQRACRAYAADPVSDEHLAMILQAATHAPSAENRQPWVFVVVRDAATRAAIDGLTGRVWAGSARHHAARSLAPGLFAAVDRFMTEGYGGAPVLVVAAGDGRDGLPPAVLASSVFPAVQNLLLAAAALGYGSALTTLAAQAPGRPGRRGRAAGGRASAGGGAPRSPGGPAGPAPPAPGGRGRPPRSLRQPVRRGQRARCAATPAPPPA